MVSRPRTLDAGNLTEIAIDFTRPVYLVKMLFPAGSVFMSTGPQITYSGDVYQEGQVSVGSFTWNSDGTQAGEVVLSNENNSASALILNGTVNDVEIEIYKTYLIAGGGNTTPVLFVKGSMDGSDVGASSSRVGVLATTAQTGFIPNRYFTIAEGFNWLPVEGEKITWGDEVFILTEEG
jgi:hypothetical protein